VEQRFAQTAAPGVAGNFRVTTAPLTAAGSRDGEPKTCGSFSPLSGVLELQIGVCYLGGLTSRPEISGEEQELRF